MNKRKRDTFYYKYFNEEKQRLYDYFDRYHVKVDINDCNIAKLHNIIILNNGGSIHVAKNEDDNYYLYAGMYYHIKENYYLMEKHYSMAIKKGNSIAEHHLDNYYNRGDTLFNQKSDKLNKYFDKYNFMRIKINEHNVEKLYSLIFDGNEEIDLDSDDNYYLHVGMYYHVNDKYDKMEKYYLMAIAKDNIHAMINLASHYEYGNYFDCEKVAKYYLMAIEKGDKVAKNRFEYFVRMHVKHHKNLLLDNKEHLSKYTILAANKGLLNKKKLHIGVCCNCHKEKHIAIIKCNHENLCLNCFAKLKNCPSCHSEL